MLKEFIRAIKKAQYFIRGFLKYWEEKVLDVYITFREEGE